MDNRLKKIHALFSKIGVNDILSLALIPPKRYENREISSSPKLSCYNTFSYEIKTIIKRPRVLSAIAWVDEWQTEIEIVFFNPKVYHKKWLNEKGYLGGKVEKKFGKLQVSQPKKVMLAHAIIPIYGLTTLREDKALELFQSVLKYEYLVAEGLPDKIARQLEALHHPIKGDEIENIGDMLKYIEMYRYLKKLRYAKRTFQAIFSKPRPPYPFIQALPFSLTSDQSDVIEHLYSDLNSSNQSRRIIVGDVGCGKTLVILATAYMVFPMKSLLLAPTSILACQLYDEALKYLSSHMKILLVTQKTKIKNTDLENADFIIGTHALLYQDIPQCGVVMIDEQHRFGTFQRQILTLTGEKRPHFFQFTATPIPRTQALIESELVDFSYIKTIPFHKEIITKVIRKIDFSLLLEHIYEQVDCGKQVIIVYPLVQESEHMIYQSIDEARQFWENRFENVYITHGKDKNKEDVLSEFRLKGKILLATTVIEVGISLPNLSTIVIVGAERLGLATLHQLRGRVGRHGGKGYCYLFTYLDHSERLERFCQLTSGFDIAELDLEYRKSGDMLEGNEQSGEPFRYVDLSRDIDLISKVKQDLG